MFCFDATLVETLMTSTVALLIASLLAGKGSVFGSIELSAVDVLVVSTASTPDDRLLVARRTGPGVTLVATSMALFVRTAGQLFVTNAMTSRDRI